jgi:hypothetical protein
MFEKEVVFQSMRGRPSGSQLREHFTKMDMKDIVNECIGRECVVVYMYPEKISGNYQKDVLYHSLHHFQIQLLFQCCNSNHLYLISIFNSLYLRSNKTKGIISQSFK